jgi:1,2-diacylglycerol 3-beta-glucosyltransferase
MVRFLTAVALVVIILGFTYYVVMAWLGWRTWGRRDNERLRLAVRRLSMCLEGGGEEHTVFFLIPCLNEELVIGDTVRNLVENDLRAIVVVVDDGSDDRTGEAALVAGGDRVVLVRRNLPEARTGKGSALNFGYCEIRRRVEVEGLDPNRVVVCVMDADGRLSRAAVSHALDRFADPFVGGVQLGVRIRNRGTLLTNIQDFEFWGVAALAQLARSHTHSVSLGGNGQFTRLSALSQLGDEPWSSSLTEDLDLALRLQLQGWRLASTPTAWVSQQGVENLSALVRQRTRWYQGHIQCARRAVEIWRCVKLSNATALETIIYLLSPLLLALPWSIIFNLAIIDIWALHQAQPTFEVFGSELLARIVRTGAWYLMSFLPAFIGGFIYARRQERTTILGAIFYGHVLVVYTYITWFCCWRALLRNTVGHKAWVKTSRHVERQPVMGSA